MQETCYLFLLISVGSVICQLGGLYGNPYGMPYGGMGGMGMGMGMGYGLGVPPMGLGMGPGMDMFSNPYGYASYYNYRCRNLLGGGMYNPLMGSMIGKK